MEFFITEEAWNVILGFASIAHKEDKNEISGLCVARMDKDGDYVLSEPEILLQENTGHTTELDSDACTEFYTKKGMKYQDEVTNGTLRFVWWHSHHTMAAFWSGTDENEIKEWKNSSWSMALVVNLKEDYKFRISQWEPLEKHEDVPLTILRDYNWTMTKDMKKQYKELCADKPATVTKWNNQGTIWKKGYGYPKPQNQVTKLFNTAPQMLHLEGIQKMPNDAMVMYQIREELTTEIDDLITQYANAKLDFKVYKTHIETLNKLLSDRATGMAVKNYNSHKTLIDAIAKNQPFEFIKYTDKSIEVAYENAEEIACYNQGWYQ